MASVQSGQWYKLSDKEGFIDYAPTINAVIAEYIGDKPFKVHNQTNSGDVTGISFDGVTILERLLELPDYSEKYGLLWFNGNYDEEGEYFEQVIVKEEEIDTSQTYGVLAFTSGGPITVRGSKMSRKDAEELAEEYVKTHTNTNTIVFKGISIYSLETQPRVIKEDY